MKYMSSQILLTNIYNTDGLVKGDAGVLANAKSLEDLMVFNIDAPFAMPLGHQNFFMLKYRFGSIQSNFRFKKNAI